MTLCVYRDPRNHTFPSEPQDRHIFKNSSRKLGESESDRNKQAKDIRRERSSVEGVGRGGGGAEVGEGRGRGGEGLGVGSAGLSQGQSLHYHTRGSAHSPALEPTELSPAG